MLAERTAYPRNHAGDAGRDSRLENSATKHGAELLQHGFTIEQVVHDYGDLCQSITALAAEQSAPITVHEFGLLNIKLDNAIAGAVTEYARPRARSATAQNAATDTRLGELAHEMRNLLNTTILAISAIKGGTVGFNGQTAAALDRTLIGMRELIDRTLAQVRLDEKGPESQMIELASFILDVQVAAALEAATKGCELTVSPVEPAIYVQADRHILAAAVANLLQNAFKFTRAHSHVILRAYARKGRILIEVEDECGGLTPEMGDLFQPYSPAGADRTGVGSGLAISRKAVEASGGKLSARSVHGVGCVFTIDLPQAATPLLA
jgi:signal transduction histidine kinase